MSYNQDNYGNPDYSGTDPRERRDFGYDPQPQSGFTDIVSNGIPKIRVIGVGGAGNNAVNRMIEANISSAEYIAVNTDAQVLLCSRAATKLQIGVKRTRGLGAGAEPEVGREAAEESKDQLARAIEGTDLLFITAGMGGGTGTGAAPVIAKIARDKHILTVAVVTKPFAFEGRRKMDNAIKGINDLRKYVDTLVIIPNEKIREVVDKSATVNEAFAIADDVLRQGIRGIADLIVTPGLINCDFADVRTVLEKKGLAHMGVGVAKGENRIVEAVRLAVNSPLLETTIEGATGIIINVVGGPDLTLDEVGTAMGLIHGVVDYNAMIIPGACIDPDIRDEVEVTVIATGFPEHGGMGYTEEDARKKQVPAQTIPYHPVDPQEAQRLLYTGGRPQTLAEEYGRPQQPAQPTGSYARPNPYPSAPYAAPQPAQPTNPYAAPQPAQPTNPYAAPQPAQPANPYAAPQPAQPTNPYAAPQSPYAPPRQPQAPQSGGDSPAVDGGDGEKLPPFVRKLLGKK